MNPWSQLPNAHHIDWVLQSMKDNPMLWAAAWHAAQQRGGAAAAWDAARDAAWNGARDAASLAVWYAARNAARLAAQDAAWGATSSAIMALVAYDDCDGYLQMSYDELRVWAILSETPQAVLLLPMKWVQEDIIVQRILQKDKVCLG